jgi:ketopantoate hydroxymethyltransferase
MYTQLEQRGMAEPPVNVRTLSKMKQDGVPIACLTAYVAAVKNREYPAPEHCFS